MDLISFLKNVVSQTESTTEELTKILIESGIKPQVLYLGNKKSAKIYLKYMSQMLNNDNQSYIKLIKTCKKLTNF